MFFGGTPDTYHTAGRERGDRHLKFYETWDNLVIDGDGHIVARARVSNDAAGFAALLTLLAQAGDSATNPIPVGIETDRGLWVAALRETGRVIYPINLLAASRYRSRHAVSGAKSDATDAVLLANIVRTDPGAHRPLPADTEAAQAIRVLARAQQDAVWARQQIGNQIRDLLKDFYPAAIAAFADLHGGLTRPDARTILAAAPTPAQAAKLTPARLRRLLIKAGRKRYLDRDITRLRQVFTDTYLHQPPVVENAMGISTSPPCWGSSRPPALPPMHSPRRRSPILSNTRTPRSSPASPAWGCWPAPGCSPRSVTTAPASLMPAD